MSIIKPNSATTPMSPVGLTPAEVREEETHTPDALPSSDSAYVEWHLEPGFAGLDPFPTTGPNVEFHLAALAKFQQELPSLLQNRLYSKLVAYRGVARIGGVYASRQEAYKACRLKGLTPGQFTLCQVVSEQE